MQNTIEKLAGILAGESQFADHKNHDAVVKRAVSLLINEGAPYSFSDKDNILTVRYGDKNYAVSKRYAESYLGHKIPTYNGVVSAITCAPGNIISDVAEAEKTIYDMYKKIIVADMGDTLSLRRTHEENILKQREKVEKENALLKEEIGLLKEENRRLADLNAMLEAENEELSARLLSEQEKIRFLLEDSSFGQASEYISDENGESFAGMVSEQMSEDAPGDVRDASSSAVPAYTEPEHTEMPDDVQAAFNAATGSVNVESESSEDPAASASGNIVLQQTETADTPVVKTADVDVVLPPVTNIKANEWPASSDIAFETGVPSMPAPPKKVYTGSQVAEDILDFSANSDGEVVGSVKTVDDPGDPPSHGVEVSDITMGTAESQDSVSESDVTAAQDAGIQTGTGSDVVENANVFAFPYQDDIYELTKSEFILSIATITVNNKNGSVSRARVISSPLSTKISSPKVMVLVAENNAARVMVIDGESGANIYVGDEVFEISGFVDNGEYTMEVIPLEDMDSEVNIRNNGVKGHLYLAVDNSEYKIHICPVNFKNNPRDGFANFFYVVDDGRGNAVEWGDNSLGDVVTNIEGQKYQIMAKWQDSSLVGALFPVTEDEFESNTVQ